jgi:phosphatidate cytidylyltransferase
MKISINSLAYIVSPFSFFVSYLALVITAQDSLLIILYVVILLLIFFTFLSSFAKLKKFRIAEELSMRTKTWWILSAAIFLSVSFGRNFAYLFILVLSIATFYEYIKLVGVNPNNVDHLGRDRNIIYICYIFIIVNAYFAYTNWYSAYIVTIPVYLFLLLPLLFVFQNRTKGSIRSMAVIFLGIMFFGFSLGHSLFMVNYAPIIFVYTVFLTEVRDLLAYWTGKILKILFTNKNSKVRRIIELPIAIDINPGKTWTGGILSMVLVALISLLFVPLFPVFPLGKVNVFTGLCFGLIIGFLGLIGDLAFGMIKRDLNVKDTGSILPGHGGLIDRVNGLVFTLPIIFHLFNWLLF